MDLKSCKIGEGCVEMVNPCQMCRTIGPLLSQKFLLESAKAQPRGGLLITTCNSSLLSHFIEECTQKYSLYKSYKRFLF